MSSYYFGTRSTIIRAPVLSVLIWTSTIGQDLSLTRHGVITIKLIASERHIAT